jgi:hypothetical protein
MAESKYGKYVIREPRGQIHDDDGKTIFDGILASPEKLGLDCQILYSTVMEPRLSVDKPHKHDFPHVMGFFGSNPLDLYDFDAEIEFYLGGEKQIINTASIVSVPAGLPHCPLNFKRIGKPVMWMEVMLTSHYERKEPDK